MIIFSFEARNWTNGNAIKRQTQEVIQQFFINFH